MHSLYFVLLEKGDAKNSQEARQKARQTLDENSFSNDNNGYFGSSKADWYVIGGRWSGELSKLLMKKDFYHEVCKLYPNKDKESKWVEYDSEAVRENAKAVQELWEKLGGRGQNIFTRDNQYDVGGADDDAMQITTELIKGIQRKKKKYKEVEVFDVLDCQEITLPDIKKENIGSWLVVVDYHM